MLELTADPVQEETKVDTSAHLQSKCVIRHSVHHHHHHHHHHFRLLKADKTQLIQ